MNACARASALPVSPPGTLATCASSASLSVAAGRLKRITWSIMMPLARPWCMSATVDSACAHECTAPRSFWNAIAPIIELISMSERAARSWPLRHGNGQRARGDAHAFERDAVAQRMIGGRQVRLDVVRQRIHAGGGGDERRQVERQLGIGEHRLGEQQRREDDLLDVRLVVGDHRRAPDLRARARGRGQRDELGHRPGPSAAPADGPTRTRGCRPDGAPSARSPSRRRAPRRRRGRSRRRPDAP